MRPGRATSGRARAGAAALAALGAAEARAQITPDDFAAFLSAPREVRAARLAPSARGEDGREVVSVALEAAFVVAGLSDDKARALAQTMPFALARCVAADYAVERGAAQLRTLGGRMSARESALNGARAVETAARYGFALGPATPAEAGAGAFDAALMARDCAANASIPKYDVIGGPK
ncbi:hypothetical protein [Oceanicella actignis]|uniref:hypothetical protein n=1 Tax=Oceanicella actignis TaxID=1189325 RepID=UPI0011E67961|nr:hypothetical protein [Oceanicella actignis]TYO90075.1 hypothetical protein LY05_01274 [Oceanicella actignis]